MLIAIDFETHLISADEPIPKPVCLSYDDGQNQGVLVEADMHKYLKEILSGDQIIVAHNMKFEAAVIQKYFPDLIPDLNRKMKSGEMYCTKIYEQLIDCLRRKRGQKYSLADLVKAYFKEDISAGKKRLPKNASPKAQIKSQLNELLGCPEKEESPWRLRYSELEGIPLNEWPKEAYQYALDDSIWALKIAKAQIQMGLDYGLSVRAEYLLGLMGYIGIMTDQSRVKTLESEILDKITPIYKYLETKGLAEQKKGKWSKKMKLFREHVLSLNVNHEYTIKKILSTSNESLTRYVSQVDDPIIQAILDIGKYEKALTAFVMRLKEATEHPIRTEYNAVVSSGRTSSRTSNIFPSVNIQQMPRGLDGVTWDIRNCYVPRPGYKICSIDYSGLELCSTANQLYKTLGWSKMLDKLNSGDKPTDMHSIFAAQVKGCTYEEFVANKKQKEYAIIRQLCKPINLGFPGGIGYDTMRSLLLRDGIVTKFRVLAEYNTERAAKRVLYKIKEHADNLRIKRTEKRKYAIVEDELVGLKKHLFKLYPCLEEFLTSYHNKLLTGETKKVCNEFGEWEDEPMYRFEIDGFRRDYCTYTEVCNGYLMQSPSAIGAKKAMCHIIEKYYWSENVNPLAFIHDEIVFEVKDDEHMYTYVQDIADILINEMQTVLPDVRIAVEAELMDYWMKAGGFWSQAYWKDAHSYILKAT